ncbi:OLC1v1012886C2 [Oldenlandia corymbosa var. corymbosa]|uniref:non-specific serine/threonine protein kinase n=1 Tax=Oldenlandia corymbosa var. corymbosa TaxID=529605 RepID=A0AAV1DX16_OLDCO|nr:OLC1v1012886C2 [Oldenlandia corymbosa var. corymbosa]
MISFIFPILCLFLSFLPIFLGGTNITTDQYALLAFKNLITSDPDQILSRNWSADPSLSVCDWIGVSCGSRHRRVTALNVSYMGLSGTIAPELGNLSFLVSLEMYGNNFHGELPEELSRLRRLEVLDLSINNLGGDFPSWIGYLSELRFLDLMNNSFTGSIPTSISNLSSLEEIELSCNSLRGSIPKGIGSLQNLTIFDIDHNQISGLIPPEIFNISTLQVIALRNNSLSGLLPMSMCNHLKNLYWLNLSKNNLYGEIPSNFSQCLELQMLALCYNEFGGSIPKEIGSLRALDELCLKHNNLKGVIPKEIGNLKGLQYLYLDENRLEGEVPKPFGDLNNLEVLALGSNNLSGTIPAKIFNISTLTAIGLESNNLSGNLPSDLCGNLPNLELLFLESNNLHGDIPKSISNCSNLKEVDLSRNNFVGTIPEGFGRLLEWLNLGKNYFTSSPRTMELEFLNSLTNCKDLRMLDVGDNFLNGYLTKSVGNLSTSLMQFYIQNNNIKGKVPEEFGNLSSLIMLNLGKNHLRGSIPETFKGLQKLQELYIDTNGLKRAMLNQVCGLPKLEGLFLSRNRISEPIPECLGNVTALRYLYLDSNRINSFIPVKLLNLKNLLELNLSNNLLMGVLPPEIGSLKVVTLLDFSINHLSSVIPSTIRGLTDMKYLSLALNQFQGTIPESLGEIIAIETLDLSHNNLSGVIPKTLEKLRYLKYFNVSFNCLSGEIPMGGSFQGLTSESFIFNKALCGDERFGVPPCQKSSPHELRHHHISKVLFVLLGSAFVAGVTAFLCFYYRRFLTKRKVPVPTMIDSILPVAQERFSYYQLAQATDGFDERNLLGKGSFGSVYKGVIDDGKIVAIKVFNLEVQGAFKSFDRECEVLRNLRHRNLTKVISNCSSPDFKALILEFMSNGSLQKLLYPHNYFLNFMQRLDIMIDVALALEYLHTGYLTPVVHCDLKPSNILLDHDMVAHLSDFGISKFLSPENTVTYTQTIATLGYIAPGKKNGY